MQEIQLTTVWIPPIVRVRSSILETTFKNGPTMMLFTPHNPYLDFNPVYSMVIHFNYCYYFLFILLIVKLYVLATIVKY